MISVSSPQLRLSNRSGDAGVVCPECGRTVVKKFCYVCRANYFSGHRGECPLFDARDSACAIFHAASVFNRGGAYARN